MYSLRPLDETSPICTVGEPNPPRLEYDLGVLLVASSATRSQMQTRIAAHPSLSLADVPRMVVTDWDDDERDAGIGMRCEWHVLCARATAALR